MAKEISRLFVTLGLADQGFKSQLKSIDKQMSALGKTMLATGAAVVAGMAIAVKSWAAAGDEVQKMSLRTKWSAESLSELRHVAAISGTELAAFEKGTRKMSQAIVDGTDGMSTYTREFDRLGLNVQELKAMKPEEAFWVIAEAMADMENEIEMSNAAAKIFGRTGTQLFPMLSEGAEGIKELRQEAHDLGIIFDEEAANKAAQLTDTMQRLKESVQGITYEIAEKLAPAIESYAIIITDTMKATNKFADEHSELGNILINTTFNFAGLTAAAGAGLLILPKLIQGFGSFAKAATGGSMAILKFSGLLTLATAGISLMITGITQLIDIHKKHDAVLEAGKKLSEEQAKAKRGEANAVIEAATAYADLLEVYLDASHLSREAKEELYKHVKEVRQAVEAYEDLKLVIADTNEWLQEQRDILQANAEKFIGMVEKIRYTYTEAGKLGVTIEDIIHYMIQAGRGAELLSIKWNEIGEDANKLTRELNLNLEALAGGDLMAQAYQTYEKEIRAIEDIAAADMEAIDNRLNYYRDKVYERERLIEEATLKEIAAVNADVAAILEGYNEELEGLDEREKERRIADEKDRIRALKKQLRDEELSIGERRRIERDLEAAEVAQREREIIEERNAQIAALNMEEYLENQKTAITQNLEDERALKAAALLDAQNIYNAEFVDFINMLNAKIEADELYKDERIRLQKEAADKIIEQQKRIYEETQSMREGSIPLEEIPGKGWWNKKVIELPSFQGWQGQVPGPAGKPYAAIVHGGEVISQPGKAGTNITQHYHISQLVVREEADVSKIARELYRVYQMRI